MALPTFGEDQCETYLSAEYSAEQSARRGFQGQHYGRIGATIQVLVGVVGWVDNRNRWLHGQATAGHPIASSALVAF